MNHDRDQNRKDPPQNDRSLKEQQQEKQRSSAFNETSRGDEKSTTNIEEEAGREQKHKEANTERD